LFVETTASFIKLPTPTTAAKRTVGLSPISIISGITMRIMPMPGERRIRRIIMPRITPNIMGPSLSITGVRYIRSLTTLPTRSQP